MFPDTCSDIEICLEKNFSPEHLEVIDNSLHHRGHAGAKENPDKGHFHIRIAANSLAGLSKLQQHRKVYSVLSELMPRIHALEITILTR